jgi:uncharacterized protein DUF4325
MRYSINSWGPFLATRERGRRVREEIESELAQVASGEVLEIDFADVEGITVSFGDECIAKLILARESGDFVDRGLVIEGANEDVRETLETVLERRKLAAVSLTSAGEPEILGGPAWLPETFAKAMKLGAFSAAELAEALGISAQAANNRLRLLVASGAAARERAVPEGGGKEFSYKSVVPVLAK